MPGNTGTGAWEYSLTTLFFCESHENWQRRSVFVFQGMTNLTILLFCSYLKSELFSSLGLYVILTLKRLEREEGSIFVTFNIVISHIFTENNYWNSSIHSEDMKIFFFIINYFHQFFEFFHISLLQISFFLFYVQPIFKKLFKNCIKLY